jgi:hypothetical protein
MFMLYLSFTVLYMSCVPDVVQVMQPKTQLIAHDKEVYDIAFACGKDIFGTVGADGSLRMFDLRYAFVCVEGLGTARLKLCCAYLPQ